LHSGREGARGKLCKFDILDIILQQTASLVERSGGWHHIAVTWTASNAGLTIIYVDGLESE
jgi:hypothetical protein